MISIALRLGVASAAMLWLAVPAGAEVAEASPDRFVTRDLATVKAAPKATWLALIEPAGWWDDQHTWSGSAANMTIVPQGGGCFCERLPEKESAAEVGLAGSAQHMTVLMAEPMKVLRMRGALGPLQSEPVDGVLSITLQPVTGGGTKLVWEYVVGGHLRYPVETISKAVDQVMSQQLGRLANKLGRSDTQAGAGAAKPQAAPLRAAQPLPGQAVKDGSSDERAADVAAELDAMGGEAND